MGVCVVWRSGYALKKQLKCHLAYFGVWWHVKWQRGMSVVQLSAVCLTQETCDGGVVAFKVKVENCS